jgi:hypothetical protein
MVKAHREGDRSWLQTVDLEEFQLLARLSSGIDRQGKESEDQMDMLWNKNSSPRVKDEKIIDYRWRVWWETLTDWEKDKSKERREVIRAIAFREIPAQPASGRELRAFKKLTNLMELPSSFDITASESPTRGKRARLVKRKMIFSPCTPSSKRSKTTTEDTPQSRDPMEEFHRAVGLYDVELPQISEADKESEEEHEPVDNRIRNFYDPKRNQFLNTGLVRYLLESHIWIEEEELRRLRLVCPPPSKIFPPGFRIAWVGAFFASLGWTGKDLIFHEKAANKGVLFVGDHEVEHARRYLYRQVKLTMSYNADKRKRIVVLPSRILITPDISEQEIERNILWETP